MGVTAGDPSYLWLTRFERMGIQPMLTVKCPHCTTALKLRQAPPAGKVKCPKCGKVVPVRAAAKSVPAAGRGRPLDPDDEGFDFGSVNFPSASPTVAVSHFPGAG